MKKESKVKKIYFFRHGEGMDDVRGEYGGWSDPSLSKEGRKTASNVSKLLKDKDFDIILTSPLKRAKESAKIISKVLKVPYKEFVYLKERNTYGILGGLSKTKAKNKYPDLVKTYNAQEFIPGAERYDDFKDRIDLLLGKLKDLEYKNILCVTHGYLITTVMEEFLSLHREEIEDGCFLGLKLVNDKFEYLESKGLTFSKVDVTYDSERYVKFK